MWKQIKEYRGTFEILTAGEKIAIALLFLAMFLIFLSMFVEPIPPTMSETMKRTDEICKHRFGHYAMAIATPKTPREDEGKMFDHTRWIYTCRVGEQDHEVKPYKER